MAVPRAPENLFINRNSSYSVIRWDKVIQDIGNDPDYIPGYTTVTAYYVYKTENPALADWTLLKKVITDDNFVDKDVFYIDFAPGNYLYRVCAENVDGIGPCAISYGIIGNPDEVIITQPCKWDVGLWDVCIWGP
jgi:hypothetical protein